MNAFCCPNDGNGTRTATDGHARGIGTAVILGSVALAYRRASKPSTAAEPADPQPATDETALPDSTTTADR